MTKLLLPALLITFASAAPAQSFLDGFRKNGSLIVPISQPNTSDVRTISLKGTAQVVAHDQCPAFIAEASSRDSLSADSLSAYGVYYGSYLPKGSPESILFSLATPEKINGVKISKVCFYSPPRDFFEATLNTMNENSGSDSSTSLEITIYPSAVLNVKYDWVDYMISSAQIKKSATKTKFLDGNPLTDKQLPSYLRDMFAFENPTAYRYILGYTVYNGVLTVGLGAVTATIKDKSGKTLSSTSALFHHPLN